MKFKGLLVVVLAVGSVVRGEGIIKVGDPESQVLATMGVPKVTISEGGTTSYRYDAGTIVVKDGKVVDIPARVGAAIQRNQAEGKLYYSSSLPAPKKGEKVLLMNVPAYRYNNLMKMLADNELSVSLGENEFLVYNKTDVFGERDGFILSPAAARELVRLMEKYQEWMTKALAMGTTLDKEIGSLSVDVAWYSSSEWFVSSRKATAICSFLSQNEKRHQMVMQFNKVSSSRNEYITHQLQTIYFDSEGVTALLEAFLRPNIDTKMAEYERKKHVEAQFQ